MMCVDQRAIGMFARLGYSVVRIPEPQLAPLSLLAGRGNRVSWVGSIDKLWDPPNSAGWPKPCEPVAIPDFGGITTDAMRAEFGCAILGDLVSALGLGAVARGKVSAHQGEQVAFRFGNVQAIQIDPVSVGKVLQESGFPACNNPVVSPYLRNRRRMYVVHKVLLSNGFSVAMLDRERVATRYEGSPLEAVFKINTSSGVWHRAGEWMEYSRAEYLPFAFKAFSIRWKDDKWDVPDLRHTPVAFAGDASEDELTAGLVEFTSSGTDDSP